MARQVVNRTLPTLEEAFPCFSAGGRPLGDALLEALRKFALAQRRKKPRPFYSMRDVATHFHAPMSTVSQVYQRLQEEGLLNTIRGSRTMIEGTSAERTRSIRGMMAMPISTALFVTWQEYRTFFLRLRNQLRLRRFAGSMAFYPDEEAAKPEFVKRLLSYQADIVVWLRPDSALQSTIGHLSEKGLRNVILAGRPLPTSPFRYNLSRKKAVCSALRGWREAGIKSVVALRRTPGASAQATARLEAALREAKLRCRFADLESGAPADFLEKLCAREDEGVIFPSAGAAALFGCRCPEALMRLCEERRVLFVEGPPMLPLIEPTAAPVDLIVFEWDPLVGQVMDDMEAEKEFEEGEAPTFDAAWLPQTPLREHAQGLTPEDYS